VTCRHLRMTWTSLNVTTRQRNRSPILQQPLPQLFPLKQQQHTATHQTRRRKTGWAPSLTAGRRCHTSLCHYRLSTLTRALGPTRTATRPYPYPGTAMCVTCRTRMNICISLDKKEWVLCITHCDVAAS